MIITKELPADGRKAGDLVVQFVVDGTRHQATFSLRVDVEKGRFIAVDGEMQYIGETKAELIDHMKTVAAAKIKLSWTRYIEVDYTVAIVEGPHRRSHSGLQPDTDRDGPVVSIHLDFDVVEYSTEFKDTHRGGTSVVRRKISDDGRSSYDEEHRRDVPDDVIPFSQERLDALRSIQTAMTAIDDRMRQLFVGKAKAVAARLDTITNQQLALPTPEATPVRARQKKGKVTS